MEFENGIKSILRPFVPQVVLDIRSVYLRTRPSAKRHCPICLYYGWFKDYGRPPRLDAQCSSCHSLERYRLFWLWYQRNGGEGRLGAPIIHFAPEPIFSEIFKKKFGDKYNTADLFQHCDLKINIEDINLPNGRFKTVICNHVLEHVDDRKALLELKRILTPDGVLIVSVPMIEGWKKTYENPSATTDEQRDLHFGQYHHVRLYGRDFRERLLEAGFTFQEITAESDDVIKHGLLRGEKFFICKK